VQDTCNVANATAIQGHLKNLLFDFRPASMVTVLDKKCVVRTAGILTAVPLFPLDGDPMFNHVCTVTRGTTNLEVGHGDLHDSMQTAF
jgi:hypothetical protein